MKRRRLSLILPEMRCDSHCGQCCGVVAVTTAELVRINNYINMNGIVPKEQGDTCPFFQLGQCAIYEVRPRICQATGHTENLPCARGYGGETVTEGHINAWLDDNGPVQTTLHSFVDLRKAI